MKRFQTIRTLLDIDKAAAALGVHPISTIPSLVERGVPGFSGDSSLFEGSTHINKLVG